jgi:hypothetical protein
MSPQWKSVEVEAAWARKVAAGGVIRTMHGAIEFLQEQELRERLETEPCLHMVPWPGAFVTLLVTGLPDARFAVALQVERRVEERPVPEDAIYRPAERAYVSLAFEYVDADTDLAALLARLQLELDCWTESGSADPEHRTDGDAQNSADPATT